MVVLLALIYYNVYFCFVSFICFFFQEANFSFLLVVENITVQTKIVSNKSHKIASLSLCPKANCEFKVSNKTNEWNKEPRGSKPVICSIFKKTHKNGPTVAEEKTIVSKLRNV